MFLNIVVDVAAELVEMAAEIRLALGLEPLKSHLALYRRFQMPELTDEKDLELLAFFRRFPPIALEIKGRMNWNAATGTIFYPVIVPPSFYALRQELLALLPPEEPGLAQEYLPHVTIGKLAQPNRNQRDLIDNLYLPARWTVNRVELSKEGQSHQWSLEAGYALEGA